MMTFDNIVVAIAAVLYIAVGVSHFIKGNMPWALIWFTYGIANFGLVWAANSTIK